MMKISYVAEITSDNPEEKTCTVLLYGILNEQGNEIGRLGEKIYEAQQLNAGGPDET